MTMAEVGLFHHNLDDIYIVMGDKFGNLEYAFRLHYKPYVQALWLGGMMMVMAALLALFGYRRKQKWKNPVTYSAPVTCSYCWLFDCAVNE